MPLRDHFRAPIDDLHSWDGLHGMWPAMIVRQLIEVLPEPYFAVPGVHLGTLYEIDIGTYCNDSEAVSESELSKSGSAVATYVAPKPTLTIEPHLPNQDVYEVRIFDSRRNRRLVAAIEIVSPSNKDRPETRGTFVSKVAALLKQDVCVSIIDVVTTNRFNMYAELMKFLECSDPAIEDATIPICAVTIRTRSDGNRLMMDNWFHPLALGQVLPTLPIWLKESWAISLELESSYEETCRMLRIR